MIITKSEPFTKEEIEKLRGRQDYAKVTVDLERDLIVVGTQLHADGEKILLEKGGRQNDIWGGGINFKDKIIDATAVLNIRPRLGNDSMEILGPERREKFIGIVRKYFAKLWMIR